MIWQEFLSAVMGVILYGSILYHQNRYLPILVVVPAILIFFLNEKASRFDRMLRPRADEASRKMKYIAERAYDFGAGKDIRIYNMGGWLIDILQRERKKAHWDSARTSEFYISRK